MYHHPKSTKEVYDVLGDFLKHLKSGGLHRWGEAKNVEGSKRKEGMLGTSVGKETGGGDLLCNGKKGGKDQSPGGVCVYYGSNSLEENIPWLKQFKAALANFEALNNQTVTIQRDIEKLKMLKHRAEEIYETTKVISEIQKPEGLTKLQNVSGNLASFNTTRTRSCSHSPHPYFIPL